jgi:hypothetical protein
VQQCANSMPQIVEYSFSVKESALVISWFVIVAIWGKSTQWEESVCVFFLRWWICLCVEYCISSARKMMRRRRTVISSYAFVV